MEARITLVSTYTIDRIALPDGGFRELPGGPAYYCGKALDRLRRPYDVVTGEIARVSVISRASGEEYIIPALPVIELPPRFDAAAVILSPIMGEVNPVNVPPAAGLVAIDLQGFVRQPGVPTGSGRRRYEIASLLARADFVKASPEELGRLTDTSGRALSGTWVLTTMGADGILLRRGRREVHIPVRPVRTTHTIGAGDIFLAAFVSAVLSGASPEDSAAKAARFTSAMLEERLNEVDGC